jgi:hypothetical protein
MSPRSYSITWKAGAVFVLLATMAFRATTASLIGHVRDANWYAQYQTNPAGVGYYEFAVNANAANNIMNRAGETPFADAGAVPSAGRFYRARTLP